MQDIENNLKNAMAAMRRGPKKKKRKTDIEAKPAEQSFSETIENIASERAEEALYAERYRRSLEELEEREAEAAPTGEAPADEEPAAQTAEEPIQPIRDLPPAIPETEEVPIDEAAAEAPAEEAEAVTEEFIDAAPAIEETPVLEEAEAAVEEAPIDEPAEEAHIDETAEEAPVAENAPIDEPTEEAPVAEEAPIEEAPVAENAPSETAAVSAVGGISYTPYYEGQMPIGYYAVPTMPVYSGEDGAAPMPVYSGEDGAAPMPVYAPTGNAEGENIAAPTAIPPVPDDIEPDYSVDYPQDSDVDGYIPPDLSGGEGGDEPLDSFEPDGELNMPVSDGDDYMGDVDYGDNPPENIDYGAPEIDALPPENIDYGAPEIDALPPDNIDYGAPEIDALPPENIDYGAPEIDALPPENIDYGEYTDPYDEAEIDTPIDLGGYPDELTYPEMSDISDGVSAIDEGNIYFFADRIEENVKVVEMRMLYEIAELKIKHQLSTLTFSLDLDREYRNERELYREVNQRISRMRRAVSAERESNRRYYLVAADKCMGDAVKRANNRAKIESVIRRMDFLLTERQRINNRLIELYTGDGSDDKAPITEKIGKKAVKVAKRVYRSMKKLAKRVKRMHAPDELREKILSLMNDRITEYSRRTQLEESLRRIKPRGAARRRMKKELRESHRRIRYIESDLKIFVKKAERYDTTYRENGKQLAWIFGTLIAVIALVALYFGFKEQIDLFLSGLFGGG